LTKLRIAGRLAGLLFLFLVCIGPHLLAKLLLGRSPVPPLFLGWCAWVVGSRVRVTGAPVQPHTLLLANHISWLDIMVLAGATGCRFVAKDDLGSGLVHWLADLNNTLYVRRNARGEAGDQAAMIARALGAPQPVALFPEGAVGPGDKLLPFRSTLLEAAARAGDAVSVRPAAIDYGRLATEISWFDEKGRDNVLRLLGRRGTIPVAVRLLDPLPASSDRKQLTAAARAAVEGALAASSPAPSRL